jgi:hypothetical protein
MTPNPILDELRKTRDKILAESGGTLDGLVACLQAAEQVSGRQIHRPHTSPANVPPLPAAPDASSSQRAPTNR